MNKITTLMYNYVFRDRNTGIESEKAATIPLLLSSVFLHHKVQQAPQKTNLKRRL